VQLPQRNVVGAGAVYAYTRTPEGWSEQRLEMRAGTGQSVSLIPSDFVSDPYRGGNYTTWQAAVSGDHIVVGLAGDGTRGPLRGSVHWFERTPSGFVEQGEPLQNPGDRDYDLFGIAVAISDDLIAVGAPGADVPPEPDGSGAVGDTGAVYVYRFIDGELQLVQRVASPSRQAESFFGSSVAVVFQVARVGAPFEDRAGIATADDWGTVYAYRWTESEFGAPLTLYGMGAAGAAVSLSGDAVAVGVPTSWTCSGQVASGGNVLVYSLDTYIPESSPARVLTPEACLDQAGCSRGRCGARASTGRCRAAASGSQAGPNTRRSLMAAVGRGRNRRRA
jgi:hypothetical protein